MMIFLATVNTLFITLSLFVVLVGSAPRASFNSSSSSSSIELQKNEKREEVDTDTEPTSLKLGGGRDLLLVQVLIRHGDRTPISLEPANPYQAADFFEGLGALTNRGKARIFEFGRVLRKRYLFYLEHFYVRNVVAQSSPLRRCLETHEALLAGLFPPWKRNIWGDNPTAEKAASELAKLWNPIGIQTVELERSWKTNPDAPCPVAKDIVERLNETDQKLRNFFVDTTEFRQKVRQFSRQTIHKWQFYGYLYDTISAEQQYFGRYFKWPHWLDEVGNGEETLARLAEFNRMNFAAFDDEQPDKSMLFRLRTGPLLAEMVENMRVAARTIAVPKRSNRKLFSYTSHDVLVGYLMNLFGAFKEQPSFGSGLLLELRRDFRTQTPMVHLFYANVTNNNEIYRLKLNELNRFKDRCTDSSGACPLEDFADSLKYFITNLNLEKECKLKK